MQVNPFEIKTPENNSAEEVVRLFVDVFTDFNKVLELNHTFLNGPRGCGKSMMFRYMLPDCQKIVLSKKAKELDYFSIYIPIKLTSINVVDLQRLENHANIILNEHLLVTHFLCKTFNFIVSKIADELEENISSVKSFYNSFKSISNLYGIEVADITSFSEVSACLLFKEMERCLNKLHLECRRTCSLFALAKSPQDYPCVTFPLVDYIDYMYPIIQELHLLPCFPKEKPFFILVDDAGYLSEVQTKILNTWVSYRTTKYVCFKISTQLDYKTYLTTTGKRIDSPHDFSEINIATIYTTSKDNYFERVKSIVNKRLEYYLNEKIDAETFFPFDIKQQGEIDAIAKKLREDYYDPGKPYASNDAANRYAVPDYIKFLKQKRSGSTYSYAGFKQLVNISSGIVRHFLAPASEMYAKQLSINSDGKVHFISDNIQNDVICDYSDGFLKSEFDEHRGGDMDDNLSAMLFNMIDSLGQLFHKILMSDCTERRVFSIALNDQPDKDLQIVLDKAVQLGFFHEGSIGNKSGLGRSRRYVLCRVLAPYYKLDPNSFAGYQFMNCSVLKYSLISPNKFLRSFSKKIDHFEGPTLFD